MTNTPRDPTGRPISPTDLADVNDPTPPLSPKAEPTPHQQAAMDGAPPPQPPKPPRRPGSLGGYLAWLVILALVGFLFASNNGVLDRFMPAQQTPIAESDASYPAPDPLLEMQGRYLIGSSEIVSSLMPSEDSSTQLADTLESFANDDPVTVLRIAIIAGELVGPGEPNDTLGFLNDDPDTPPQSSASAYLNYASFLIDSADEASPHDDTTRQDIATLRAIYANPGFDSLSESEHDSFIERHGWLAELALTFGDDDASSPRVELLTKTRQTAGVVIGAGITVIGAFIVGFILFILALVFLATGSLKMAYRQPTTTAGTYAETFALFLIGFLAVGILASALEAATSQGWWSFALIWLLPLVAFWPRLRGVPKDQWKLDVGWNKGKGIIREVFAGILGYLAGLPIVAIGIGCTFALMIFSEIINRALGLPDGPPTHPIAEQFDPSNVVILIATYITACVWAPFVEETIFRGALYHNTRRALHPIFAALFTGFLFAAIHPQGWIAIPALMSLGTVFALLREWRGSIIAPAIAHAINNGFVFTVLIFALS
ncbi:MAG: CPBP family intramembrane glutamic endopeptidase [Phycisphaerales bacterium JB043]